LRPLNVVFASLQADDVADASQAVFTFFSAVVIAPLASSSFFLASAAFLSAAAFLAAFSLSFFALAAFASA
jgi:hypothetical protein